MPSSAAKRPTLTLSRRPDHAPEADIARRRVDRLALPRGGPVTARVVRSTEVRAAFLDFVPRQAGWCRFEMLRRIPVGLPFPHVPDHVVQRVSIRWERRHARRPLVSATEVLVRE